jgi:cation diffusion facilitator CzcD-associated flavoprotein CzcO
MISTRRIAIIGSGFSGLCLAIQLKKSGIDSFTIFEQAQHLGGTWRDNHYPGAACDVPSFAYSFSFEAETAWTHKWAPHDEILRYMERCAEKYDLYPHIRFSSPVASACFDETTGQWLLRTTRGEESIADILVSGCGQLNRPVIPDIAGLERFQGKQFHSARWDHSYDLSGKTVGVVGTAASAIQFVPEVAKQVDKLHVFQRSPNWMFPRFDRAYSEAEKRRFQHHPWLARLYRWGLWGRLDLGWPVFRGNRLLGQRLEKLAEKHMRSTIEDPVLADKLVPDYPIGGKRLLISDGYYATLNRDNVALDTNGIQRVTEAGVVTGDGREIALDALIFATGFATTDFLVPLEIEGREHHRLHEDWKDGAEAYLGLTVSGYPNFFMLYGPNTNLGHNSIIFMIECQALYILGCIRRLCDRNLRYLDVRPEAQAKFNHRLQKKLRRTVWAVPNRSWYKQADGRITNNWSGPTIRYWWQTRKPDFSAYVEVTRPNRNTTDGFEPP